MADSDRLTELGLGVTDGGAGVEAILQLGTPLLNPLAQRSIPSAVFALAEECLIPLEPPEFVGLPPLQLVGVRSRSELEQQLAGAFHTHLVALQRRSAELKGLGLSSQVDPETLELIARLEDPRFGLCSLATKGVSFIWPKSRAMVHPPLPRWESLSTFPSFPTAPVSLRTFVRWWDHNRSSPSRRHRP